MAPVMFADVIWPALILEGRILTWWAILAGLIVEYFFILRITGLSPLKAALADLCMNGVSTLLGIILIPLAGFIWEIFPGSVLYKAFNIGTFNPGTWAATVLMAAALNTYVERTVLRLIFKQSVVGQRHFWLLFLANVLSVSLAVASLFYWPPKL